MGQAVHDENLLWISLGIIFCVYWYHYKFTGLFSRRKGLILRMAAVVQVVLDTFNFDEYMELEVTVEHAVNRET